jgi:hypothetical protein
MVGARGRRRPDISVLASLMLPALAFIVAAYVIFRIISEILRGPARYPNVGMYVGVVVIGIVALLVITANCIDIYSSATSPTSQDLPSLR